MMTIGSLLTGGIIGVLAAFGFFSNLFVLVVMVKGQFLSTGANVMYIMAFNLMISDTIHLSFNLFYQAPASALQRDICFMSNVDLSRVGGFFCLWMWNNGGIMLALLSTNRLIQICYPDYARIFTRRKTVALCLAVWPACLLLTATSQYFLPCCEFVIFYPAYSYNYVLKPNITNYSIQFVDTPSNCFCSLAIIINYSMIICKVREARHNIANGLSEKEHTRRRMKEYKFALQFLAISAFYTVSWISFRIYPMIIPFDQPKWFSLAAITSVLNASVNAWVYLYCNPDICKASRRLIGLEVDNSRLHSCNSALLVRETAQ